VPQRNAIALLQFVYCIALYSLEVEMRVGGNFTYSKHAPVDHIRHVLRSGNGDEPLENTPYYFPYYRKSETLNFVILQYYIPSPFCAPVSSLVAMWDHCSVITGRREYAL
jgi:hypothetical protein